MNLWKKVGKWLLAICIAFLILSVIQILFFSAQDFSIGEIQQTHIAPMN